jgi:hypothetical protein
MRIALTLTLGAMLLSTVACNSNSEDVRFHYYEKDDPIYKDALNRAQNENPKFFRIAEDLDIRDGIVAVRILGETHECVNFVNTTSIIIEDSLPLYCYDDSTRELSGKL